MLNRIVVFFMVAALICLLGVSCTEKKEGKVIVTEQQFNIRQDSESTWVVDAKGKVKNAGEVDLKKVVITGYCRSCGEVLTAGVWFISNVEKLTEQKDMISYLPVGEEDPFSFKEIAYYYHPRGQAPEIMPDEMEVVIESFEIVDEE